MKISEILVDIMLAGLAAASAQARVRITPRPRTDPCVLPLTRF